jgi:UDP-hydrolysing UDP-N-acetyl-D-glucosamine 2-epimerase
MVLERFGLAVEIVKKDGFFIDGSVYIEIEGSLPITMAKTVGLGIIDFSREFERLQPDIVLIMGDRYEALAATLAAAFMNISVAHIQGGEVSGSIDESTRHAISKMSHLHFPSTARSAEFLLKMGEDKKYIHNVGCPAGDYIITQDDTIEPSKINSSGVGVEIDLQKPFILVIFHPVTTQLSEQQERVKVLLSVLHDIAMPCIWLWPNIDAGSEVISRELRKFREKNEDTWLRMIKNLEPELFQKLLKKASCAVGNSSSFIRDTTFTGTPVVLVGDRQDGRECGHNLVQPEFNATEIKEAILHQLKRGRYQPDTLYGNGTAGSQIVEHLKEFIPYKQKRLSYVSFDNSNK